MFETNFSHISRAYISKSKRCFNVKSSTYYLHMKTKILTDFKICTSAPLNLNVASHKHLILRLTNHDRPNLMF